MKKFGHAVLALCLGAGAALAQEATTYPFDGSFDDATFAVESAIIDRGLVIDYRSHVGEMLNRTGADVGSDARVYDSADVFLFCSAVLSRKVMEVDPLNIAQCPMASSSPTARARSPSATATCPKARCRRCRPCLTPSRARRPGNRPIAAA